METLSILTFIKYFPDDAHAGGGEVTVWNTIRGLAERGHTIYAIACNPRKKTPEICNVRYCVTSPYCDIRPIDFKTALSWLIKSIKIRPDVIHSFYAESFATNLAGGVRGIPVVQEVHYADLYPYTLGDVLEYSKKASGLLWAIHLRFAKTAAKAADVVVTPSNYMKEKLSRVYGLLSEKISVIPVGVNEDVFSIKKNWKSKDEIMRLLFAGRLVREKGLDVLLKALPEVLKEKPNTLLTVVGEGPLKNEYIRFSEKLEITKKVSFVGFLPRNKILAHLKEADILIVPSIKENFPRITLEGMGVGVPVIASLVGGIPEQITDGVDGILVPPENPEKLAASILELASDSEKAKSIGREGRKTAAKYTLKKKINSLEKVYARILSS